MRSWQAETHPLAARAGQEGRVMPGEGAPPSDLWTDPSDADRQDSRRMGGIKAE